MTLAAALKGLIQRFQENRDVYCSSKYNKAEVRHEFVDPLRGSPGCGSTSSVLSPDQSSNAS